LYGFISYGDIGKTIHPHPTLGESIGMAAEIAHGSCTDLEMAQLQADLLQSVREMKAGTFARSTQVRETEALQARAKMDLSQPQFAKLLGVSVRTLQEWEQGRKKPTGAAQTLLRVAVQTPQALLSLA
jgi:putative transcriptional regulator